MVNSRNSERNVRAASGAQARTESAHALPLRRADESEPGAEPSNTAPANSIEGESKVLRVGVDSLYLSFSGLLAEVSERKLVELKQLAQSDDMTAQSNAILQIENSRFKVLPSGTVGFPYILADGMFNIRLSSAMSAKMPLASVQVSSSVLTQSGMEAAVEYLEQIIRTLGNVEEIRVSRVDVCCDFNTCLELGPNSKYEWISRSNKRHWYAESERFSGIVFGQGSFLSARLYDKTLQIKKSKQDYLRDLWWLEGWDRESQVWRLEFQFRRAVLVELGISSYEDLKDRVGALWRYATQDWLRLVCPSGDQTRSRWPDHPLWSMLQRAEFGDSSPLPISRQQSKRIPLDSYFFINGLAAFTSFMAARGIRTFKEAGPKFLEEAAHYHAKRELMTGEDIEAYCQVRARKKARDYSTRFPYTEGKRDIDYRKGKGK